MIFVIIWICIWLAAYIYIHGKYNEFYWKRRGVTFYPRNKITGLMWNYVTQDKAFFEHLYALYKEYSDSPAVGFGSIFDPALYVKDPKNVQHILQNDFQSFAERGLASNEGDLLADNILFLHGPRWKLLRQHMTPLFTAAKLKNMYYIIDRSAMDFIEFLKKNPQRYENNAYDTINEFCSAAVAGAVFGIGTESYYESPFLKMARQAFAPTTANNLKFVIGNQFLALFRLMKFKYFTKYEDFFISAIKRVIRAREAEGVKKHDFADICVSLQNNGTLKDQLAGYEIEPTDEVLAAQAFFFFNAGVEPCATAIFGALVELGRNPDILKKLHEEIDDTFEKNNGQLNYDAVCKMEYIEKILNESLRMYPPIGFLTRKCISDTILPVGNIKVDKGTNIYTPIYEYHHDSKYYAQPENFDPDRISCKNERDITYLPFGKGSRNCIGARYARLQVKAGILHLLRNFNVKTVEIKNRNKFGKETVQVRLNNVDLKFTPRF